MATLAQTIRNTSRQTLTRIRHYRQLCVTQITRFAIWCAQLTRDCLTLANRCASRVLQDLRTGLRALLSFARNLWVILQEIPPLIKSGMRSAYQYLLRGLTASWQFLRTIAPALGRTILSTLSHTIGLIVGVCAAVLDVIVESIRFLGRFIMRTPATVNAPSKPHPIASLANPNSKIHSKPAVKSPAPQNKRQVHTSRPLQAIQQATKRRHRPAR